jgi:hypothetical protein
MTRIGVLVIGILATAGICLIIALGLLGVLQIGNTLLALIFFGQLIVVLLQLLLFWTQLSIMSAQSEPSLRPELLSEPSAFGLEIVNDSNNMARSVQFEQAWSTRIGLIPVDENLFRQGIGIKIEPPRAIAGGMLRSAVVCSVPGNFLRDKLAIEISYVNLENKKQFMHFLIHGDPNLGERIYDVRRGAISEQTKLEMRRSSGGGAGQAQEINPAAEGVLSGAEPLTSVAAPQGASPDQDEKGNAEVSAKQVAVAVDKEGAIAEKLAGSQQSLVSSESERSLTNIEDARRSLDRIVELLHKKKNEEASKG